MIAMEEKVPFESVTLDFCFTLQTWGLISVLLIAALQSY